MSTCNSNCGNSCGCSKNCNFTRVGALGSLCRSCNYPFYTGPCPPAPCNGCGCEPVSNCCETTNATTTCSCGSSQCGCKCHSCGQSCNSCQCHHCGQNCNSCQCHHCGQDCNSCQCHSCGCSQCPGCGCEYWPCDPTYALYAANGPISLQAGGIVPWTARNVNGNDFILNNGSIQILRSGMYYAALTADIPANTAVNTTIGMSLNNQPIVPPQLVINTASEAENNNYAGHTIFYANEGSVLQVNSLNAMTVGATTQPVFTLTLFRLPPTADTSSWCGSQCV